MKFMSIFLVILLLCFSNKTIGDTCNSGCQMQQIHSYFKALDNISRKGASVREIDSLLSLMHVDVKYSHVEYAANFDKTAWRKAFVRNLERGAYQNGPDHEQRILKTIPGKNYIAVEYSHGVVQPDGTWRPQAPLLILFGFTDSKISLVQELW